MNKIINLNNDIDFTKEPLFLGEGLGIQRYDRFKYPKYFSLFKQQIGFSWRPEEYGIEGKERNDFKTLSDHERFIFTSNLKYQTLLDSAQARGIPYLQRYMSNPEFEIASDAWKFFETVHSYSYTYIVKNVYPQAEEVFGNILNDEEIVKRAVSVSHYYNDLIDSIGDSDYEIRKKIYLTLISINILEGIRFYVSFACSYCFAENGKMEGNAKIIAAINRDENVHLAISQMTIKLLRTVPEEGFMEVAADCEDLVYQMYKDAAEEEKQWARYLFDPNRGKGMLGLTDEILIQYMEWLTNKRLRGIGLKYLFPGAENPINWIEDWTNSKRLQNAPQETEIEQYIVGAFKHDLDDVDFSGFKL
jgi:ribonucleoside-diphosphate reductase beta chain